MRAATAPAGATRAPVAWRAGTAPDGAARSRLPPLGASGLVPAFDAALAPDNGLLDSLRRLDCGGGASSSGAPRPNSTGPGRALPARALRSISRYGCKANARAAEADSEFAAHDAKERHALSDPIGAGGASGAVGATATAIASGTRDALKTFEGLVASIDLALAGGEATLPAQVVRRDDPVTDTLPMNRSRHYRIPLPSRPTAITVTITRSAGASPTLWGSTSCDRPHARNYDLKGKDDKLLYEHALLSSADAEDDEPRGEFIDRRNAVPACRDLFIAVEADAGEVTYTLTVTFGPIKIALSRQEIANQVQRIRRGWEVKLIELQREPELRAQFEEHLRVMEEERVARKRAQTNGRDFVDINSHSLMEAAPQQKKQGIRQKALQSLARHGKALSTKQDLDQREEERKLAWLNRCDERKRARELQEMEDRRREERLARQRQWLRGMALFVFATKSYQRFRALKEMHEFIQKQLQSATVLHRYFTRSLSWKRRIAMYANVLRLRAGLAMYARVMRPLVMCAAAPAVRSFLTTYAFHKEVPSVSGALRRFRANVVKIQRWFRMSRLSREAYFQVLQPTWMRCQVKAFQELAVLEADRVRALQEQSANMQAEAMKGLEEFGGSRNPSERRKTLMMRKSATPLLSRKDLEQHQRLLASSHVDDLPEYASRMFLRDYVLDLITSHPRRVQEWQDSVVRSAEWASDLEKFGVQEEGQTAESTKPTRKPAKVYVDPAEMEQRIRSYIIEWRSGNLRHIKANRTRLLKKMFHYWVHEWRRATKEATAKVVRTSTSVSAGRTKSFHWQASRMSDADQSQPHGLGPAPPQAVAQAHAHAAHSPHAPPSIVHAAPPPAPVPAAPAAVPLSTPPAVPAVTFLTDPGKEESILGEASEVPSAQQPMAVTMKELPIDEDDEASESGD